MDKIENILQSNDVYALRYILSLARLDTEWCISNDIIVTIVTIVTIGVNFNLIRFSV